MKPRRRCPNRTIVSTEKKTPRSYSIPPPNPVLVLHHNGNGIRRLHNLHTGVPHREPAPEQLLQHARLLRLQVPKVDRRRRVPGPVSRVARLEQRTLPVALARGDGLAVAAQQLRHVGGELAEDAVLRVAVAAQLFRGGGLPERVGDGEFLAAAARGAGIAG